MKTAILLTGAPRCGKTTLLQKVLAGYHGQAGGFYTREVRQNGQRTAFEMVTLDGKTGTLAGIHLSGPPRVGKYGVDLTALESVGVPAIRTACQDGKMVVVDEIGPMEIFSAVFCQTVLETLDAGCPLFGTIVQRSTSFGDRIKARREVEVIEVTPTNRDDLVDGIIGKLCAMTNALCQE
ncbi:MAG: nucleoside-triphosphatase [Anaerolineaceae bacterium]|jgi:nucleoside-triphosphatase THEP1|nr:nucleoside-triphosphatase [Anaerolineaceae bacterium]